MIIKIILLLLPPWGKVGLGVVKVRKNVGLGVVKVRKKVGLGVAKVKKKVGDGYEIFGVIRYL